jgi:hypothetical protein
MRLVTFLFYLIPLVNFSLMVNEHTLSTQLSYHSKQEASAGYGIIYQYQFLENVELEAKYNKSGDLKVITDQQTLSGNYDSFSSGINFIKSHYKHLTIKFGFGLNTIVSSSNNLLIEANAITPYFQIAANYRINDRFAFTLGQSSYFNKGNLGTNHSLFLSFDWLFGQQATALLNNKTTTLTSAPYIAKVPIIVQPKLSPQNKVNDRKPSKLLSKWYVQVGAYQQKENAQKRHQALQASYSLSLTTLLHNKLYRILSQPFADKQSANEYLLFLQNSFQISGFVNKI